MGRTIGPAKITLHEVARIRRLYRAGVKLATIAARFRLDAAPCSGSLARREAEPRAAVVTRPGYLPHLGGKGAEAPAA